MDQGIIEISELRRQLARSKRRSWVRAVGTPISADRAQLLFAQVHVGLEPEGWVSTCWRYEQSVLAADDVTASALLAALAPGATSELMLDGISFVLQLADAPFSWERKPSLAQYDETQLPWPSQIFTPRLETSPPSPQAPGGFLVGQDEAPSFPAFGAAFRAFFFGDYSVTGVNNPILGQLSIRVVDERARIQRVGSTDDGIDVWIGGRGLRNARLEFNSRSERMTLASLEPGRVSVPLPSGKLPPDAWVWLKQGSDWLDFRSLQRWGGHVSRDVDVEDPDAIGDGAKRPARPTATIGSAWLRERACEYSQRALAAYVDELYHDFFLFAGLAVELAIKARLAEETLVFLAPDKHFSSTLALWGARDDIARLPTGTRTVGGMEALARLIQIQPSVASMQAGVTELLRHRNGEAHLGTVDATLQNRTFISFLRAVNAVLAVDQTTFWFPHTSLVRVTLDGNAQRVQREVHLKISKAIEKFKVIQSLDDERRDALVSILANRVSEHDLDEATVECPACKSVALAFGTNVLDYGEPDFGPDGNVEGVPSWLDFTPLSLRCEACGLHLNDPEELAAAGVAESWVNQDDDVVQAYREIEAAELAEVAEYSDWEPTALEPDSDPEEE
ncbi:MAG: hypothetical protein ACYDGN_12825 [Acidimicrobiales bacterium]